jgi:hypothetical protein
MTSPNPQSHREQNAEAPAIAETGAVAAPADRSWVALLAKPGVERVAVAMVLAIIIWAAHFSQSIRFGLYEDDWAFVGQPIGWSWENFRGWISMCFSAWPQGRPIGFATVATTVYFGSRLGGIEALYFIAAAAHLGNALLVYAIVRRRLSAAPSLCAALAFALFPSNTAVPLLTNSFFGSLTLFFLLFAIWLYLKGWRVAAYAVSLGSLLTYESAYLPFFAAPLLESKPLRQLWRSLLKHWAIMLALAGSLFLFRTHIGEAKAAAVVQDGVAGTVGRIATAIYIGPFTTLKLFFGRILTFLRDGDHEVWPVVIMAAVGLTIVLYFAGMRSSNTMERWPIVMNAGRYQLRAALAIDQTSAAALETGASGAVMVILAYGLAISAYYYPPTVEAGRLTSTHLSAAVGSALVFGALASLLIDLAQQHRKKILAAIILSCYLSGLVGFHYRVQQDFRKAWHMQRIFWKSVLRKCPDLKEGTLIIYETNYDHPPYVMVTSWGDGLVLGDIYRFPANWKAPPLLISASSTWPSDITRVGDELFWHPPAPHQDQILPKRNVILLRGPVGGELKRITGTISLKSMDFPLKPLEASQLTPYPHIPVVYDLLLR